MQLLVGVDEAGRGPLAGPVAVGLVCAPDRLDLPTLFPGLNDSKKLKEAAREQIYTDLERYNHKGVLSYTVVLKETRDIDNRGIAVVIKEAIAEGVTTLMPEPTAGVVYLDGSLVAPPIYTQQTIIKGDTLIPAIMLASVAAKVVRDRLMCSLSHTYPHYAFDQHKGYGTALHRARIKEHGPCAIHRQSFLHIDRWGNEV